MNEAKRIVVAVDDQESVEEIFKLRLKSEIRSGMIDFHFFSNGKGCLDFLAENEHYIHVVLLLSDINMPEMNGLTLLEAIKKRYPNIKVYMASAYDAEDYQNQAKALGADGYLVKPIDFKELRKVISTVV